MAEGIEETESNSGSTGGDTKTSMLGAAIPCDIISPVIGSLKREFDSYSHSAITAATKTMSVSPISPSMSPTHQLSENNNHQHHHQHHQHSHHHLSSQQQPINLKSEVSMKLFIYKCGWYAKKIGGAYRLMSNMTFDWNSIR